MRTLILAALLFTLLTGETQAGTFPYVIINQALVASKLLPVGTEVKIKVVRISDQFAASLGLVCFPESPFKDGEPGTGSFDLKYWLAKDLQAGDILRYTTTMRGFIGVTAGPFYRNLQAENSDGGHRLTLEYNDHQWQVELSFPDYDQ